MERFWGFLILVLVEQVAYEGGTVLWLSMAYNEFRFVERVYRWGRRFSRHSEELSGIAAHTKEGKA